MKAVTKADLKETATVEMKVGESAVMMAARMVVLMVGSWAA